MDGTSGDWVAIAVTAVLLFIKVAVMTVLIESVMQLGRYWWALLEFRFFKPSWWFDYSCACSHFGSVIS